MSEKDMTIAILNDKIKEIERLHLTDTECSDCGRKKISFNGNLFCYHCCWTTNVDLQKQNQELKEKIRKRIKYWDKDTPENMMFEPENMDIKSKDLVKFYSKLIIKELSSLIEGGK